MGKHGNNDRLYLGGLQSNCRWWLQPWNKKTLAPWKKSYDQSRQLINLYAEYILRNAGLEKAQAGIKIAGRNINDLRYASDTTLMAESQEELKSLLMKEESEKVGLKLNIQKTKIMASGPITSWQNRWRNSGWLFFWAPKSLQMMIEAMKLKDAYSFEGKLWPT